MLRTVEYYLEEETRRPRRRLPDGWMDAAAAVRGNLGAGWAWGEEGGAPRGRGSTAAEFESGLLRGAAGWESWDPSAGTVEEEVANKKLVGLGQKPTHGSQADRKSVV